MRQTVKESSKVLSFAEAEEEYFDAREFDDEDDNEYYDSMEYLDDSDLEDEDIDMVFVPFYKGSEDMSYLHVDMEVDKAEEQAEDVNMLEAKEDDHMDIDFTEVEFMDVDLMNVDFMDIDFMDVDFMDVD